MGGKRTGKEGKGEGGEGRGEARKGGRGEEGRRGGGKGRGKREGKGRRSTLAHLFKKCHHLRICNTSCLASLPFQVPYCGLCMAQEDKNGLWELANPPIPPLTHGPNVRFDWKVLHD